MPIADGILHRYPAIAADKGHAAAYPGYCPGTPSAPGRKRKIR